MYVCMGLGLSHSQLITLSKCSWFEHIAGWGFEIVHTYRGREDVKG